MRVKSPVVGAIVALFAVLGCLAFTAGEAQAGIGGSALPNFPADVTVGQTYSAHITIQNKNDYNPARQNTVCNLGDTDAICIGDPGVLLNPSCGGFDKSKHDGECITFDPNVYKLAATGTGSPAAALNDCPAWPFTITPLNNAAGESRFAPAPGAPHDHILLDQGHYCEIDFTFTVLKAPTVDYDADPTNGLQTVPTVRSYQSDQHTNAFDRGTTEPVRVNKVTPTIATTASASVGVGGQLTDLATVSGRVNPVAGATVTFNLYGPNNAACANPPVATSTIVLQEPGGTATSAAYPTTDAGDYRWMATYNGDANNSSVVGPCNAPNELTSVGPAKPTLSTSASSAVTLGGQISDTATVSGRSHPIAAPPATVTFNLYGPNDATCATAPIFTVTKAISEPGGTASSGGFTPAAEGKYRWVGSYSGDANNAPATGACNDPGEDVVVTKVGPNTPSIVTTASANVLVNNPITDTAVVSGRVNPIDGATVAFNLYGPDDATCALSIFTVTVPLPSNGTVTSTAFIPTKPGTYRWTAAYSGDANNNAVSEGCNGPGESVVVTQTSSSPPVTPNITTVAGGTLLVGGPLSDKATVTNRNNPLAGSTVTFNLYGPNDATCAGAVIFTSTVGLDASGNATSAAFNTTTAGTYRWVASYSGDTNNNPVTGSCGDAAETQTVVASQPTIITVATVNTAVGGQVGDTAQVTGLVNPVAGATVTFNLYGPDNATCANPAIFTSTVALGADGTAVSATYAPTAVGTYRWIASYSGDANNSAVAEACNAANESVQLLGPDFQQSLPATGARTSVPLALGSLLLVVGSGLLYGVRRRPRTLWVRR